VSQLTYDIAGHDDAPPLVVGPSIGTTLHMWDAQVPELSKHFRVIRYNHPGHGGSAEPPGPYTVDVLAGLVLELVDELGIDRFHYAGLSLGGMIGMTIAAREPERIDRLALVCTSAHLPPAQQWLDRAATVRAQGMRAVVEGALGRWFTPAFTDREPYADMLAGISVEGYASCCEAIAALDLRPVLGRITAATMVVSGLDDPSTPPDHGRVIADSVPNARFEVVAGAAHLAAVEQPAKVTALLRDHLVGDQYTAGMRVRRAVLGDEHVDQATATANDFTADFHELLTRYAWGSVWTRPGLTRRTRSCITLAMLAALGHHDELALHVRAALRNGLTSAEIREVLLQVGVYAGIPAANTAFRIARRVLDEDHGDPA
jgi:3-oxoadipate enol-lactonase / 4-carboxymuconolactone decarboxylase